MNVPVPVKSNSVSQPTGARWRFLTASSYCEPLTNHRATPAPMPATRTTRPMISNGVRRRPRPGAGSTVVSISARPEPLDDELDALVGLDDRDAHVVGAAAAVEVARTDERARPRRELLGEAPTIFGIEPQVEAAEWQLHVEAERLDQCGREHLQPSCVAVALDLHVLVIGERDGGRR